MKPSQDIKPITYMKSRTAELVKSVANRRRPMVITQNGEAKVVVLDLKSYERDREALFMLKLLMQGMTEADSGELLEHDGLMESLKNKVLKSSV